MSEKAQDLLELLRLKERGWPVELQLLAHALNIIAPGVADERGGC